MGSGDGGGAGISPGRAGKPRGFVEGPRAARLCLHGVVSAATGGGILADRGGSREVSEALWFRGETAKRAP